MELAIFLIFIVGSYMLFEYISGKTTKKRVLDAIEAEKNGVSIGLNYLKICASKIKGKDGDYMKAQIEKNFSELSEVKISVFTTNGIKSLYSNAIFCFDERDIKFKIWTRHVEAVLVYIKLRHPNIKI